MKISHSHIGHDTEISSNVTIQNSFVHPVSTISCDLINSLVLEQIEWDEESRFESFGLISIIWLLFGDLV